MRYIIYKNGILIELKNKYIATIQEYLKPSLTENCDCAILQIQNKQEKYFRENRST